PRPRKTSSGFSHQTSARMVSPNERRGKVVAVPFIVRPLLRQGTLLSSKPPSCREHSKAVQILLALKRWWQCWRDIRFHNKQLLVWRDPAPPPVSEVPAGKCGALREHARASIRLGSGHRRPVNLMRACLIRARSSAQFPRVGILQPPRLSFRQPDRRRTWRNRSEYNA